MNELWEFESKCEWNYEYRGMHFYGKKSGIRYIFRITQEALIYCFQCNEDTPEAAEEIFKQNRDKIESVAKRYASEAKANDDPPHYTITKANYENLVGELTG
ncbi:DUF1488 family protein [Nitrosomonas sp. Nm58]|uniref:DUF1488 family protein n=1 Tax=Nitrosomonas sp. Nm58 TaxID=200126 RepID=UPI00089B5F62|nr:DUF1488 family protein [Nitrosomonas sp. Nm58]SDY13855.1 Protein of unknown function [Nitrosomonas sp. Nm58]